MINLKHSWNWQATSEYLPATIGKPVSPVTLCSKVHVEFAHSRGSQRLIKIALDGLCDKIFANKGATLTPENLGRKGLKQLLMKTLAQFGTQVSLFNGHFRNLNWRYLSYKGPIFSKLCKAKGISPQNMDLCGTVMKYLNCRILKWPLTYCVVYFSCKSEHLTIAASLWRIQSLPHLPGPNFADRLLERDPTMWGPQDS